MTGASVPAIRVTDLSRHFGSIKALDAVTLDVPRGIVFGLLGPNGAGKTTLIRLLLGLVEPTSGSGEVLGYDIAAGAADVRARCGALLEHNGLYERLSAEDNLDLYARFWRLDAPARRERVRALLSDLDLWERRREIVAGWSRGMKQKLAIARALLHTPDLLFLDEPTAGLDPLAARALRAHLARLAAGRGATIFLTTHNLAEAEALCARVAMIRGGRLVAEGTPAQLRGRRESLEDVFMELMEAAG